MGSKKKLILAISSFSFVLVTAIVAVVAIFAAQNQGVQTTFRISYTAKNVAASVRANYTVGATTTAMLTDSGEDELVFLPEMAEGTGKLSPETDNIALEDETSVVLEYIFSNDSDTVDVAISLDTSAFVLDNMRVSYAYSYSRITNYATMPTDDSFEPMVILGKTDENGDYDTLYVYMKVEVDNLANDASFTGNILYNLDRATPVKLDFGWAANANNGLLLQPRYVPSGTNINDLPIPYSTGVGENYGFVWSEAADYENLLTYPLNLTTDYYISAETHYYISAGNKTVTIEHPENSFTYYIKVPNGTRYSYGESIYVVENDEYLITNSGQSITFFDIEKASTSRQFTSMDLAMEKIQIGGKPKDLDEQLFYAAYGKYPQTYVGNELNETLKSTSLVATGKTYNVSLMYVRHTAVEYKYEGKTYAKLTFECNTQGVNFANGEPILGGETYFFYVEPIVSKAMQKNADGTYTMMSLEIMGTHHYEESGAPTDWKNTDLREYLNGTFAEESGLSSVVVTTRNQNDMQGSGFTNDDVWVATPQELLYWSGTLNELNLSQSIENYYSDANNSLRLVNASDFAMLGCQPHYCYDGYPCYFMRSLDSNSAYCVYDGGVVTAWAPDYPVFGFIPMFAVNL